MAGAVGARFDSSSDSDGLVYRTEDEALKAVKENGRNLRNVPLGSGGQRYVKKQ